MILEAIDDIETCRGLWERFSPKRLLWNEWEPSIASYKGHQDIRFFALKEGQETLGIIPLHYDREVKRWYLFGSSYSEDRRLWVPTEHLPFALARLPRPFRLIDLNGAYVDSIIAEQPELQQYAGSSDHRFFIDLAACGWSAENFFKTMGKKHRHNLLYDLKKNEEKGYAARWERTVDLELLARFNKARFGDDSDYADQQFIEEAGGFFTSLEKLGILHSAVVSLDGEDVGIEVAAIYNSKYYVLNGGHDRSHKNVGKRLIMEHIKRAISLQAKEIDFLVGDTGWKELWNMQREPVKTLQAD